MLDWQDILDKSHVKDTFELSPDTQALILSCLASHMGRFDWFYDEEVPDDTEWDEIESGISLALKEATIPVECEEEGAADYILRSVDTLVSDETTYELTDLHLLDGRDLKIEMKLANSGGSVRHFRGQINGLTTSIYSYADSQWGTSAVLNATTATYYNVGRVFEPSTTPQNRWGWLRLECPLWKDTDRDPYFKHQSIANSRHGAGQCMVAAVGRLETLLFYPNSGGIKAGSQIAVYTRG